jgi:Domain of unknown function (DUF4190)
MTAPGGEYGEAHPPTSGGDGSEQPQWQAPWAPPPMGDYPPPGYQPPGYQAGYSPYPSSGYEQPGYGPPPGYEQPRYGPPPYPGGYYPAPDYSGGYGTQGAQAGMNGLAIASLISSFAGVLCCIGSVAAIVMGAIALDQVKRNRQDGYGLAVAGIVIGIATLVVNLVVVMFAMRSH